MATKNIYKLALRRFGKVPLINIFSKKNGRQVRKCLKVQKKMVFMSVSEMYYYGGDSTAAVAAISEGS